MTGLPLRECAFLNLVRHCQPLLHRRLQPDPLGDPVQIMAKYYGNGALQVPLLMDLEHDKRQLAVRFPHRGADGRGEQVDQIVCLAMRYSQLRRALAHSQFEHSTGKFLL